MKLPRPRNSRRLILANNATGALSSEPPFAAFLLHRHPAVAEAAERRPQRDTRAAKDAVGSDRGER